MKQKPILFLSLVLITALCAVCAPKGTVLDFFTKNEGYHPKNVNLVAPDAINCPTPLVLPADANCMAEVIVQTAKNGCGQESGADIKVWQVIKEHYETTPWK